jgi:hypothetical protein
MSIELQRVPADWKHPTDSDYAARGRVSRLAYEAPKNDKWCSIHMNRSWGEATRDWWRERIKEKLTLWLCYWPTVFGWIEAPAVIRYGCDEPHTPPRHFDYRPHWRERSRTHVQLYETVSEGTPISPVMPSVEALAEWCAAQEREVWVNTRMDKAGWLRFFARGGWAPSMVITPERGVESGAEFMAREEPTS